MMSCAFSEVPAADNAVLCDGQRGERERRRTGVVAALCLDSPHGREHFSHLCRLALCVVRALHLCAKKIAVKPQFVTRGFEFVSAKGRNGSVCGALRTHCATPQNGATSTHALNTPGHGTRTRQGQVLSARTWRLMLSLLRFVPSSPTVIVAPSASFSTVLPALFFLP